MKISGGILMLAGLALIVGATFLIDWRLGIGAMGFVLLAAGAVRR